MQLIAGKEYWTTAIPLGYSDDIIKPWCGKLIIRPGVMTRLFVKSESCSAYLGFIDADLKETLFLTFEDATVAFGSKVKEYKKHLLSKIKSAETILSECQSAA